MARYLIGGGMTAAPGILLEGPDLGRRYSFTVDVAAVPEHHPFGRLGTWTFSLNLR